MTTDLHGTFTQYYTEERVKALAAAFTRVRPAGHWKGPIDALVAVRSDDELADIEEAVSFYTGSVADCTPVQTVEGIRIVRVQADGYYAVIGA